MMARKKMDLSPPLSQGKNGARTQRIPLSRRPLAPWLRLAHASRAATGQTSSTSRLRTIADFEIVLQLEGSAWIYADPLGGSLEVPPGYLVLIPPNYLHAWGMDPGAHIAVHFDLQARPDLPAMKNIHHVDRVVTRAPATVMPRFSLAWPDRDNALELPMVTHVRDMELWKERLMPLVEVWMRRAHLTLSAQLLFQETIGWALRTLADDAAYGGLRVPDDADPRILALLRELESGAPQRPSVDELAARAHMGLTAFREAFQKATGRPPRQYLEERRIERAARVLMETNRKLYDVAAAEGYDDPYHFSRIFRRVMGVSPRQYRSPRSAQRPRRIV